MTNTKPFTLSAAPGTDIWRKPPHTNIFKASTHSTPSKPLSAFVSAKVTFSASWEQQYDQAGLLLTFQPKDSESSPANGKWIKTGLEFYEGLPQLSTVACDRWADWSVTPLPGGSDSDSITVAIEREESSHGTSLWVYHLPGDGKKVPLREICWVYGDGEGDDISLTVSAYACRPEAKKTEESLQATFHDLDVKWN